MAVPLGVSTAPQPLGSSDSHSTVSVLCIAPIDTGSQPCCPFLLLPYPLLCLLLQAGADFVGFVNKYLRDEVGILRRAGGDGGNDRGQGGGSGSSSGGGFLLELRGFSRSAGGREAPAVPPLGQACMSWHSKGCCKFGDACHNTHVPRRSFTDRTDKHNGSKR